MNLDRLSPWISAVMSAAILGYVGINLFRYRRLLRQGLTTRGLIVGAEQDADEEADAIVVAFEDNTGRMHQIRSQGAMTGWSQKIGRSVTVVYDPAWPTRARIREDVRLQTWVGVALTIVFAAISLGLWLK